MAPKAVIFDMDGVLVDTEPENQRHIQEFFADRGLELPKAATDDLVGCTGAYFLERINEWWAATPRKHVDELAMSAGEAMDRHFANILYDYPSLLNPGVPQTLDGLRERGIRCAVASSTERTGIVRALEPCGILDKFAFVLSGEDFEHGKPAPDIYLAAAVKLGLDPTDCIAIEDSDRGILAARRAGMRVAVKREKRFGFAQEGGSWYLDRIDELLGIVDGELQ
jgi:HAD superfamily hydrolase (TIGR01509 family)